MVDELVRRVEVSADSRERLAVGGFCGLVAGCGVTRCEGDSWLRQGALCHGTSDLSSGMWSVHPDDEITSLMERRKNNSRDENNSATLDLYLSKNKYKSVTFVMLDISKIK